MHDENAHTQPITQPTNANKTPHKQNNRTWASPPSSTKPHPRSSRSTSTTTPSTRASPSWRTGAGGSRVGNGSEWRSRGRCITSPRWVGGLNDGVVCGKGSAVLRVSIQTQPLYTKTHQQLLFLDEATSALDQDSEAHLLGSVLATRRRATGMAVVATGHGGRLAAYHDRVIGI